METWWRRERVCLATSACLHVAPCVFVGKLKCCSRSWVGVGPFVWLLASLGCNYTQACMPRENKVALPQRMARWRQQDCSNALQSLAECELRIRCVALDGASKIVATVAKSCGV